MKNLVHKFKRL